MWHVTLPACPHTFSFGGTCTSREWHLGVQTKIWGCTFWKSVIGVHTSMASRLIHGNSLYQSIILEIFDPRSFPVPDFDMHLLKVCNFIVSLRLICPFRQLSLLCRHGFNTVSPLVKTCENCFTPFQHGKVVLTTWWNMRSFVTGQLRWMICFRSVTVQVCISARAFGAVRQIRMSDS